MSNTPRYDQVNQAVAVVKRFAEEGFPGCTFEQLVKMTSYEPENNAKAIQRRAERNLDLLLRGCWEIHEELEASGLPLEYRRAVYMERLGVKRGNDAFELMEVPNEPR